MSTRPVKADVPGSVDRIRVLVPVDPSAKQRVDSSMKTESDINVIVARYKKTGLWPAAVQARASLARYGDVSQVPSYAEMQARVMAARDAFAALPAAVRRQFGNDPGAFVAAVDTPEGIALLKKLGLGAVVDPDEKDPNAPMASSPPKDRPTPGGGAAAKSKGGSAPKAPKVEEGDQE